MQCTWKTILTRLGCLVMFLSATVSLAYYSGSFAVTPAASQSAAAVKLPEDTPTIILDAGHGGIDGGCSSVNGVPEKGINLNILLHLEAMLRICGYHVEATRETDRSIHDEGIEGIADQKSSDMDNRLALFNRYENALCLSIHQNQFTASDYHGAQMFYSNQVKGSEKFAQNLQNAFVTLLQPENQREIKLCGKELFLCYFSKNPTVMSECGFLSNPEEAALLESEEYQQKVAFTLFCGIESYFADRKN